MPTTPLATALTYFDRFGWPLLPCQWRAGPERKAPLIENGFYDASVDRHQIEAWWRRWPSALIGVATGKSGLAVLDIDVKNPRKYGPDSLDALGRSLLDDTWVAHTPSGGWHCWYDRGEIEIPSSNHTLGPGLDVRASTGYIIAPSPGSGYAWDPHFNPDTTALAKAPAWLIPPLPIPQVLHHQKPVRPCEGLSPYADAAIERACCAVRDAVNGRQRETLVAESFSIGTLAGAGGIPADFARRALIDAGSGMPSFDPRHPWTEKEIVRTVNGCFAAGVASPRPVAARRATR